MIEVKTFEEARKLTIKKWEKVSKKLNETERAIGEHCGFCYLANYEVQQTAIGYKCNHCLVENKCEEYKEIMLITFDSFQEWVDKLIFWLDDLKEKDTTSRCLENKNDEQHLNV